MQSACQVHMKIFTNPIYINGNTIHTAFSSHVYIKIIGIKAQFVEGHIHLKGTISCRCCMYNKNK